MPDAGAPDWENPSELEAFGIGPLEGQLVRIAGLYGGGLSLGTPDGWALESLEIDWPDKSLLLTAPSSWLYETRAGRSSAFTKIEADSTLRAYGFSPTGKSLVVALTSDITIYSRS
jgi:hypothetical protein